MNNDINQEKFKELEEVINHDYANTAGIIIQRNGMKLYEKYFNGSNKDNAIHVCSVTKSIFSLLIGIAIDQGYIKSVNQKVLDFFPHYTVQKGEEIIQHVTLKNLLTMTAPYKYETEPYVEFFTSPNWVQTALNLLGGEGPIGNFLYSPLVGVHILSGILSNVIGQPILDFANKNLFSPLGINPPHNIIFHSAEDQMDWYAKTQRPNSWVVDPQGLNTSSWGLCLTPLDFAKIGQLYLNGGMWNGQQIVSTTWINESTKEHSKWNDLSYGYLWWIIDAKKHIYAALGDGGNVIYINETKKLVITIASFLMQDAKDRLELISNYIEPLF